MESTEYLCIVKKKPLFIVGQRILNTGPGQGKRQAARWPVRWHVAVENYSTTANVDTHLLVERYRDLALGDAPCLVDLLRYRFQDEPKERPVLAEEQGFASYCFAELAVENSVAFQVQTAVVCTGQHISREQHNITWAALKRFS